MPLHLWLTLAGVVVALTVIAIVSLILTSRDLNRFERRAGQELDRAFPASGQMTTPLLADSDFLSKGD